VFICNRLVLFLTLVL